MAAVIENIGNQADGGRAPAPSAAVYVAATRAYSFPASIVPVLLGTALALRGYGGNTDGAAVGHFSLPVFALTLAGALLAHAGGNVLNDYFDFTKGIDTLPEHGSGVLPRGDLTPAQMLRFGIVLLAGGGLCGLLLPLLVPGTLTVIAPLALLGLACAVLYTAILKRLALGDLVIMAAFGLGLTLGAYGVQHPLTGGASPVGQILLFSLPLTLLVDAILHANNMRDAANDTAKGYRTVASLLGTKRAGVLQAVLVFGPVVLAVTFAVLRLLPWPALATLLALPMLLKAYKSGDVPFTAQSHLLFGVLYAAGIALLPRP